MAGRMYDGAKKVPNTNPNAGKGPGLGNGKTPGGPQTARMTAVSPIVNPRATGNQSGGRTTPAPVRGTSPKTAMPPRPSTSGMSRKRI